MPTALTIESPFLVQFSFSPLIEKMRSDVEAGKIEAPLYEKILTEVDKKPELNGCLDSDYLIENEDFIHFLLAPLFPESLSNNEIMGVSIPFSKQIFNPTQRLKSIIKDAGPDFELQYRDFMTDKFYIMSCCIILNQYYQIPINTDFNLIYDIPNKNGYINHYRIMSNADFINIQPTERSIELTEEDIVELLDNYENLDLWKEKFPMNSWILNGFVIIKMYDSTTEVAISNLKGILIQSKDNFREINTKATEIFKSIFNLSNLEIGFTAINHKENLFEQSPINEAIKSKLLAGSTENLNEDHTFIALLNNKKYLCISDIERFQKENSECHIIENLCQQNIQSAILIPIHSGQRLIGILEIVSTKKVLNSINATKIEGILPFLLDSMNTMYANLENHILALIQQEYTSIHPSVYWKFYAEAKKHINLGSNKIIRNLPYQNIKFEKLTPLYGQSDIKSSSQKRNTAIVNDLKSQLTVLHKLILSLETDANLSTTTQLIDAKVNELDHGLKAYTESDFLNFLKQNIYPLLNDLKFENLQNNKKITAYFSSIGGENTIFNTNRKHYEDSLSTINKELCDLLDSRFEEQQNQFPFYFERFRTDGVDHDIYIGQSIAPWLSYHPMYLHNLRLAQLRVIIESDLLFQRLKQKHNYDLEITSLILTYSTEMAIRFRMDEKRFDVDGSYNARYEVIKKRIDKAFLKNSEQRLVQPKKIALVFSQDLEKEEYIKYISILQQERHLKNDLEIVELENLQGVVGLKAIRISIDYSSNAPFDYPFFNHEF